MARIPDSYLLPIEDTKIGREIQLYTLGDTLTYDITGRDWVTFRLGSAAAWPASAVVTVKVGLAQDEPEDFVSGAITYTTLGLKTRLFVRGLTHIQFKVSVIGSATVEKVKFTGRATNDE